MGVTGQSCDINVTLNSCDRKVTCELRSHDSHMINRQQCSSMSNVDNEGHNIK